MKNVKKIFFVFFLSSEMLLLMDVPEDVLPPATKYLKIYFLGSPGLMVYNFGASIVRSTGNTKKPLFKLTGVEPNVP